MCFLNWKCNLTHGAHTTSLVKHVGALARTASVGCRVQTQGSAPLAVGGRGGAVVRRRGCWFICPRGWRPCLGALGPHRSPCGGVGGLGGTEAECVGFAARPAWVFQRIHSARPPFSLLEKMAALEKDHGAQEGCGAEEAPGRRP